jgi:hypothetical protein
MSTVATTILPMVLALMIAFYPCCGQQGTYNNIIIEKWCRECTDICVASNRSLRGS